MTPTDLEFAPDFDLSTHVERSRKGPCLVCAYLGGHPDYAHEPVYSDDWVVAFLSQYPTLLGYTIVAPRPHVVDVTGDRKLFRRVIDVVHDAAEALKKALPTERVYLMSLRSARRRISSPRVLTCMLPPL